ncbi:hypothetical protein [Halobaculum sp. D14]|uniref:hypothetical protein n=1 Tax=Halobaculum sp. D14 TaxID=3421642 RepID=UPI003EB9338D
MTDSLNEGAGWLPRLISGADAAVAAVAHRVRPADVLVVAGVPAVLLAVFALPRPTKLSYALAYAEPTLPAMYASHFVHLSVGHLASNLLVYLAVVPVALALSARSGRRRLFFVTFVAVLVAFPWALSALNMLFPRHSIGYGFSGLNMAFLGFLPHAITWAVADCVDGAPGDVDADADADEGAYATTDTDAPVSGAAVAAVADASPALFFVGTAVVSFWAVPLSTASAAAGVASVVAVAVYGRAVLRSAGGAIADTVVAPAGTGDGYGGVVLVAAALSVLLLFPAFPAVSPGDGTVLNVFTHLLGYCFGYIVPFVAFRLTPLADSHVGA